jgi:hypothetical protein
MAQVNLAKSCETTRRPVLRAIIFRKACILASLLNSKRTWRVLMLICNEPENQKLELTRNDLPKRTQRYALSSGFGNKAAAAAKAERPYEPTERDSVLGNSQDRKEYAG